MIEDDQTHQSSLLDLLLVLSYLPTLVFHNQQTQHMLNTLLIASVHKAMHKHSYYTHIIYAMQDIATLMVDSGTPNHDACIIGSCPATVGPQSCACNPSLYNVTYNQHYDNAIASIVHNVYTKSYFQ